MTMLTPFCAVLGLLLLLPTSLPAQTPKQEPTTADRTVPPLPAAMLEPMLRGFQDDLVRLRTLLAEKPNDLTLLSARGDAYMFLGRFAEAVEDYERMIQLDAAQDARHWRLGIAYYMVGAWEKSSQQFAKYHAHDARDRENGIWKFLADTRGKGLEYARAHMLPYTRFDREPFPALYDLLAGKLKEGDFWSGLEQRGLTEDKQVMFFAHYYVGLHLALQGQQQEALRNVQQAVAYFTPETAGQDGPGYMWQVARLHFAVLQHNLDAQP